MNPPKCPGISSPSPLSGLDLRPRQMSQVLQGHTSWGLTGAGNPSQSHHPAGVIRHAQAWARPRLLWALSKSWNLRRSLDLASGSEQKASRPAQPVLPCPFWACARTPLRPSSLPQLSLGQVLVSWEGSLSLPAAPRPGAGPPHEAGGWPPPRARPGAVTHQLVALCVSWENPL